MPILNTNQAVNAQSTCPKCQRDITGALAAGATKCPSCGQEIKPASSSKESPAAAEASTSPAATRALSKLQLLQLLLVADAAVLALLGALLILAPKQVELAFKFKDLPAGVSYLIGMWGCVLVTMAVGYAVAATNPIRHVVWVQVGIARGALECLLGLIFLARGTVTFQQAGFGIMIAAVISTAYVALYPRQPRLVKAPVPLGSSP